MPSGKTHDAITFLLAAPAAAAAYLIFGNAVLSAAAGISFVFGGLMFGPDLDTRSTQSSRWWILRPIWLPYRKAFKHRSRWSHGIVFGTLFRVIYFLGIVTLLTYLGFVLKVSVMGGQLPQMSVFSSAWSSAGDSVRNYFGALFPASVFAGMWAGAASHTFTDMAGTYIKTGRVSRFL